MPLVDASIVAVTVYSDRARVTRRGQIALEPGEHTLTVENLPITLDEDSVRASGRGADVVIRGVDVKTEYLDDPLEFDRSGLEERMEALKDEDNELRDALVLQDSTLTFLNNLSERTSASLARSLSRDKASLDDVTAINQYLAEQRTSVQEQQRDIRKKREKLVQELDAATKRQKQRGGKRESRYQIQVTVEVETAVEFELEVTYAVRNASWTPLYDVRLLDDQVELTYLAQITQKTGEDWPEVDLSLSTARPAVSTTLPELDPWYLDTPYAHRPVVASAPQARGGGLAKTVAGATVGAAAALLDAAGLEVDEEPATAAPLPQAAVAGTAIESSGPGGVAVTYRVSTPVAVPSDGTPHKTTITIERLDVSLDYVAVPKLAEEAYLRATVSNTSDYTLLPGTASIYHGMDFVGKTRIETIAPTEEFKAQLGVDDRIRVKRKLVKRDVGKTRIGNTRRSQFAYQITLTNHLPVPAHVTVFDQIPVGRHENIKTKLDSATPEPDEQSDLNRLKWELELETQEEQAIDFTFTVEHPRNMTVMGLN